MVLGNPVLKCATLCAPMPEDFKMTTTNKTGDIQNVQEEEQSSA